MDGLTVKFDCPTIWNSRYLTYELTRVDLGRTNVVTTSAASPKLVRCGVVAGTLQATPPHVRMYGSLCVTSLQSQCSHAHGLHRTGVRQLPAALTTVT